MSKEKLIQECETKWLIDELSKMPPMVIATAYLHAINYTLYGEDVTKKWLTVIQNTSALEKAYRKGYYDALEKSKEQDDFVSCAAEIFENKDRNDILKKRAFDLPVERMEKEELEETYRYFMKKNFGMEGGKNGKY